MGLYLCTSVVGLRDGGASERGQGAHEKRSAARERREGAGGRARRIRARSGEHRRRHPRINDQKPDPSPLSVSQLAHEILHAPHVYPWAWPLARQVFVYYMYEYDDSTYSKRYAHHGAPSGAPLATPVSARERAQALVAHARSQNPASRKCRRARYDAWHGPRNTSTRPVQGGRLSRLGRRGERLVRVERRPRRPGGRPKGILKGPMRARHGAHERQHRRLRGHAAARRHALQ